MENGTESNESRRLIGGASIAAAGMIYQQGISFLSVLLVARVVGATDYGIFNLARNLVQVTGIFTRLGLDVGLQRYFGETQTARDRALRIAVLRQLRLLASAVALLPVFAVALGLGRILEESLFRYPHFADVLLVSALALPFLTDLALLGGAYRGIMKLSPSVMAEYILLPTIRLAAIVILFVAGWRLWAVVVGTSLGSLLASAFLAMRARADFYNRAPVHPYSWVDAFRVARFSIVLAGSMVVGTLTGSIDKLMLGYFTTAQDVGQYSLVQTLVVLIGLIGVAFNQSLAALVAERHTHGDVDGMVHVMSLSARWVTLATLPIFAIFLFWGAQLTLLLGPSFATSQTVVSWLAVSQFLVTVFSPSGWALSMTGKHVLELKILLVGLVIAALLCWLAVPVVGQLGAAVATCASLAVVNLGRNLFVRQLVGVFPFGSDIFVIMAAGIGLAWGGQVMVEQIALPPLWNTIAGIGFFLVAYGVVSWTQLLNESEKSGIFTAIKSTGQKMFGRTR